MSLKKWVVSRCDKDRAADIAENCGIEPFAAFLLCARGMTDEFEVESFLYDTDLIDPFTLPDMAEACERVSWALENNEKITVFGDYDADGVTSTALMYSYLLSRGADVDYYIPDRAGEGYGMNNCAIDILKGRGTSLIITVDNGISAIEEIKYASTLGIDVIVTDHHRVGEVLPEAVAVVDPHRDDAFCEFTEWAGVGVAFKFICALDGSDGYEILQEYGDLVALGTVADIVSLKGENRILVRSGVAFMNAALSEGTLRKGLKALMDFCDPSGVISSNTLAFRFAPRINAAGRMESAERALKLLLSDDDNEAAEIAREISDLNTKRQEIESGITESAIEIIENNPHIKYQKVIVVKGEGWHQGVIGIVASRLVERYAKPCIVISDIGGSAKGSGRSIDGFSLYDALSYCEGLLTQYGGHVLAAGLSIDSDKIDDFRQMINKYAASVNEAVPVLNIDCRLNPVSINTDILSATEILEPFGADNPQPLFGIYNMELAAIQPVGNGKHLRLTLRKNGHTINAIMFSVTVNDFQYSVSDKVDLAVRLSANEYMGKTQVSIQVKDIRLSNFDDEKLIAANNAYEAFCRGENLNDNIRKNLCVDRDFCGNIYRFIKNNKDRKYSAEVLCYRLGCNEENLISCKIALDVLCELGIIICKDGKYILPDENVKNNLENSAIFKRAEATRI
ncbi:MAG: single-stranded-DNA-specific exonuclease RecJ [Clostridia bacterium]|nr:single-stranded-DNA-specific exonuclease RecJ [Clostridia bacterium]